MAVSLLLVQASYAGTFVLENPAGVARLEAEVRAAQFLTRATFGPTRPEIDELASQIELLGAHAAFNAWIDEQFAIPPSGHRTLAKTMIQEDGFDLVDPEVNAGDYREFSWWHIALTGEDQLRQRIAWSLYQIAPVNDDIDGAFQRRLDASGEPAYLGISNYYDMLAYNSFGNYRNLLRNITLHPVMGTFLSHALNPKGIPELRQFPDENFAREIMQLFSIGVYELETDGRLKMTADGQSPIETYDNLTIEAMARVFTGLYFAGTAGYGSNGRNYNEPMLMDDEYHDTDRKVILSGVVLPAGQSGMKDIRDTLDTIFYHPNVGPYIGKLLIQRLVKSNPSPSYIESVANAFADNGLGVRGDMRAVIKAILLHPEALNSLDITSYSTPPTLVVEATDTARSRLREPILRYSAFLRGMKTSSTHPSGRLMMSGVMHAPQQSPYRAPSVFGYYDPDYVPARALQLFAERNQWSPSRLTAPEFEVMTSASITALSNLFYRDVIKGGHEEFYVDSATRALTSFQISIEFAEDPKSMGFTEILQRLNMLFCRGAMSDSTRNLIEQETADKIWNRVDQARVALLITVTAPDCAVVQ
jgi:uncharacterized protein (DUF1800 family)